MRFSSPGVLPSSGHPPHSSEGSRCPHLVRGITVLLAKDVMVPVPPADMKAGFFSPYFIVPKKAVGYDQSWVCASWTGPFISLLSRCSCRTASSDASVPKFGLQHWPERPVLPCVDPSVPQAIPAVGIRRTSISVQVLPFGLSLSPRVFTKVAEAALVPLREQGVRILNYLDDWLILAQSWDQLCEHRDRVLSHLSQLGLQVNWEKSRTLPGAEDLFSRYGVRLGQSDSAPHAGTRSVGVELLEYIQEQDGGTTETVSEAPGAYGGCGGGHAAGAAPYETASTLAPWPSPEVGVAERHAEGPSHSSLPPNLHPVVRPFIPLGRSAPGTGLQARCGLHRRLRQGLGGHVQRACSVGGLDGSPTALAHQLPRVAGSTPEPEHVLVRTDNSATVAYINRQGGLRSRRMSQPARHLLLWSRKHLRSLRAIHIPGLLNRTADELSRAALPGEWRLHPQTVQLIWRRFGLAQVDLFASLETSHCQLFYSLTDGTLGTDALAHSWPRGLRKYAFPPVSLLAQTLCKVREEEEQILLAYQDLVPRADAPRDSPSLADSSEEGSTDSETGHLMAPASRPLETSCLVPRRDAEVLSDLPQEVVDTITLARAPSTKHAYTLKWNLFEWCSSHTEDPRRCPIRVVLSFLQQGLERRLSPSTLKVYVAAIAANHDPVEGKSVGKYDWVVRFLRGARRLNPPRPPSIPSWDLSLVLRALQQGPFEPLQTVEPKFLSMKTLLLLALASIKRVGDLHAFSVDDSCLQFGPADSQIILRPRPGYVPKVPTTPFRDQVVSLQALPPEEADPALALLCPVRALRHYVDRTQSFRTSDQLFVCHGGRQKGNAVSRQRMAHWIVDAITLAYQAQGVPCPFRLRAHSTRSVASSWALARGASLTDICRAVGWATPNTFARFYSLRVEPVSSCVLTSNG